MIPLPNARREWPCKNKDRQARECGQMIYQSDTQKFRSGKNMVLNAADGRGGKRGDPHVCPDRVNSYFHKGDHFFNKFEYNIHQQNKFCGYCCQYHDATILPLCPTCFKLMCSSCSNLQTWIFKPEIDNNKCNACGNIGMQVHQVFYAYMINARDDELDESRRQIRDARNKALAQL